MTTIAICGAGTMGSGIAQVAATAGYTTILYDLNEEVVQKARASINKSLQSQVDKNRISAERSKEIIGRIHFTSDIRECVADLIIEAIVEKLAVKISLFNQLAQYNRPETIFASNTSSLSLSAIAREISDPSRVAGLHFFNPAPLMKLVEVVKAEQSSEETISSLVDLTRKLGKVPVVCRDAPGFIVNRVARPYYIESLRIAEEGLVDYETIDRLMENQGFKMGPFRLMDLIGNDVNYAVSCSVYDQLGKPERLRPSPLQKDKVEKNELGRKTGRGYFNY